MEEGKKVLGEGKVFIDSGHRSFWLFTSTEREGAPFPARITVASGIAHGLNQH